MLKITFQNTPIPRDNRPCGACGKQIKYMTEEAGIKYGQCGCSLWYYDKNDWKWYSEIDANLKSTDDTEEEIF